MPSNYLNLFLDAEISNKYDQERYSRHIDAAIAQEAIKVEDILGVGEKGTGSKPDLCIVERQTLIQVSEVGMFNKRTVVERISPIAAIGRLRGTQEGYKGCDITITAHDTEGEILFRLVWGLGGPDWVEPLVLRQQGHLFKLISDAMDKAFEAPPRPSVSIASSKAGALMDWAADVVKASGVEVTTDCIEEHANMIAAGIRMLAFLKLGAPFGIDDLNKFFPRGEMPEGTPLETFDEIYGHVVARVGSPQIVDREIDDLLAGAWGEYVNGCREAYG